MGVIDILIYILASFGLIFTIVTIIESYNNCIPYCVYNLKKDNCNQIIIKIRGFNNCDTSNLIEKIKNGEFDNIYEIAEDVKIMKYN